MPLLTACVCVRQLSSNINQSHDALVECSRGPQTDTGPEVGIIDLIIINLVADCNWCRGQRSRVHVPVNLSCMMSPGVELRMEWGLEWKGRSFEYFSRVEERFHALLTSKFNIIIAFIYKQVGGNKNWQSSAPFRQLVHCQQTRQQINKRKNKTALCQ